MLQQARPIVPRLRRSLAIGVSSLVVILVHASIGSKLPASSLPWSARASWSLRAPAEDELPLSPCRTACRHRNSPAFAGAACAVTGRASFGHRVDRVRRYRCASRTFRRRSQRERERQSRDGCDRCSPTSLPAAFGGLPGVVCVLVRRTPVAEAPSSNATGRVVGAVSMRSRFILIRASMSTYPAILGARAVVITAAMSLIDISSFRWARQDREPKRFWGSPRFSAYALIGVMEGIVITIGLSLLTFIVRAWRPYRAELGQVAGFAATTTSLAIRRANTCRASSSCTSTRRCYREWWASRRLRSIDHAGAPARSTP